jgi:hypothetical protein
MDRPSSDHVRDLFGKWPCFSEGVWEKYGRSLGEAPKEVWRKRG